MEKFETIKTQLKGAQSMDNETGHMLADDVLEEIALCASRGELNELQVKELIEEYRNVGKWYA